MRLSKIYMNHSHIFESITFNDGFNAILGKVISSKDKNTHNLGKSILAQVIDYCLGKKKDSMFFQNLDQFNEFVFFLEIEYAKDQFVTVSRSVSEPTTMRFKYHNSPDRDYRGLLDVEWDKTLPFEKSKALLDSLFNFQFIKGYSYRRLIGYLLRTQDDFQDPFRLSKHKGKDINWKPFLAKLLGFDDELLKKRGSLIDDLNKLSEQEHFISSQNKTDAQSVSDIEGEIELINLKIQDFKKQLDELDFGNQDKEEIAALVDLINDQIVTLNDELFYLENDRKRIKNSLRTKKISFSTDEAQSLFNEAGLVFPKQIKRSFDDLIQFNEAINQERIEYLSKELKEIEPRIQKISEELAELNKNKAKKLAFLNEKDIFDKYKSISNELNERTARLIYLEKIRDIIYQREDIKKQKSLLSSELESVENLIRDNVTQNVKADSNSLFTKIRAYFSSIIQKTLNNDAFLSVNVNSNGNMEFEYKFAEKEAHNGHSYKKLLCIAFDMALARVYTEQGYRIFLYHDGVFESLDDRLKEKLLAVMREYSDYGLQQIITLIDADIPNGNDNFIYPDEIIKTLHDRDDSGLLFKMPAW
nr:MAG TPA: putative ATPase [Caudoviricetes sp.]